MIANSNSGREQPEKISHAVSSLLTGDERILAVAVQNAFNSPFVKDAVVVTTRRFILYRPKLFGRMDFEDLLWQDVIDIRVSQQLLGASIKVKGKRNQDGGEYLTMKGLVKEQARSLYAKAQEIEEQWREKGRIRNMEEERARSGGVFLQSPAGPPASAGGSDVEARLAKLKSLHGQALISDAEYEARKAQIIADL